MKIKRFLILILSIAFIFSGCSADKETKDIITACSSHGSGAVTNFDHTALFLLNGKLYTFNESANKLELFCNNEKCEHRFSEVLTEPSQCPAALGKGYKIGSYNDELYAAVSDTEKCFKKLNHVLEIVGFECAFYENYFYYFSCGSLKRVKLVENAESETVLDNMAGSKDYQLNGMTFYDNILVMTGGLTSVDTWIYDADNKILTKSDIEATAVEYYDGKLYYLEGLEKTENVYTLFTYSIESGERRPLIDFTATSMNTRIAVDKDYIYLTMYENIQIDGRTSSSTLAVYTHDGKLVKEIALDAIENDMMKTVMCSNDTYIFFGNSNAIFDQSLYIIEKSTLKENDVVNLIRVN